jgi:hypothetical protein
VTIRSPLHQIDHAYATHNNRLLCYELYDEGQRPRKQRRTVTYTYYDDGDVPDPFGKLRAGIAVKDKDPTGGSDPAYDRHRDLALYYNPDKSLRVALWGSYTLDQSGNPTGYETSWAREFFYDSPRVNHRGRRDKRSRLSTEQHEREIIRLAGLTGVRCAHPPITLGRQQASRLGQRTLANQFDNLRRREIVEQPVASQQGRVAWPQPHA